MERPKIESVDCQIRISTSLGKDARKHVTEKIESAGRESCREENETREQRETPPSLPRFDIFDPDNWDKQDHDGFVSDGQAKDNWREG